MKCAGSNLDVKDQQPPWSDHCTCPLCKREVIMTAQGTVAAHVSDLEAAAPIASSLEQRFVWIREADDYDNR